MVLQTFVAESCRNDVQAPWLSNLTLNYIVCCQLRIFNTPESLGSELWTAYVGPLGSRLAVDEGCVLLTGKCMFEGTAQSTLDLSKGSWLSFSNPLLILSIGADIQLVQPSDQSLICTCPFSLDVQGWQSPDLGPVRSFCIVGMS